VNVDDFSITASWDRTSYAAEDDPAACLLVEIAPRAVERDSKIPADLVFVLDVSGSMNRGDKYPLVRQAILELVGSVAPEDRVGFIVFSHEAASVLPLSDGTAVASHGRALLAAVEGSPLMFGRSTRMAPGLVLALDQLELDGRAGAVRRVYALTDGEIHDQPVCINLADRFSQSGVELHVYGFGNGFDVEQIATLSRRVRGGTAKPLVNTEQVVATFRHLSKRAASLVARDLRVTVRLAGPVVAGDAFRFRPHPAWLGPIRDGAMNDAVPSVEVGRTYSYVLELRLPPQPEGSHKVASVTLNYDSASGEGLQRESLAVSRGPGGAADPVVLRARDLCVGQREKDPAANLAAVQARLELAREEHRDPGLIAALKRKIKQLLGDEAPDAALAEEDERFIAADEATDAEVPLSPPESSGESAADDE
jgi:Ca-activated chloride channel family protein